MITTLLLRPPVGGDDARRSAAEELAKQPYQQHQDSVLERWASDTLDWIDRHLNALSGGDAGANWGFVVVVIAALLLIGLLVWRFGLPSRSVTSAEPKLRLGTGTTTSHNDLADQYAADGRYAEAVRERLRAIVRSLEERDLLDPRPGRTVTEIVAAVRRSLPDATAQLTKGAQLFSDIWYGTKVASRRDDTTMRQVYEAVAAAKPADAEPEPVTAGWALPEEPK
ncbi:DUF4129 domain-containing protein [Fodinicola acaciae]|uniref:DUF4129 domain-containing protein n=1 Tax=Fodinicola acaciae TaxID=2681555 RepID=UPI0013D76D03|nr:DUF4129 domain-containing protein [Fodinicola acaciae]